MVNSYSTANSLDSSTFSSTGGYFTTLLHATHIRDSNFTNNDGFKNSEHQYWNSYFNLALHIGADYCTDTFRRDRLLDHD